MGCSGITTDSRDCPEHSLFFALKGDSFDGNKFAATALQNGCAYAVVDDADTAVAGDKRYILVDNTLTTLQQLANYHRHQLGTRIIGITGTNGKTTTKELIANVLSQSHNVLYTTGNLNNHIGVPLTLLRMKADNDLAVIEMGANHPGEIKFLVDIVEPNYGIITNVGKAHLEGFGSFEGVIRTKGELYDFLRNRVDSTVFIHHDNPYLMKMAEGLNLIPYGTDNTLYVNGKVTGCSPYLSFEWKAGRDGERHEVQTQLIGDYNFPNALAAVTIGRFFGVEPRKIDKALTEYRPSNNRSQLKETADNTLIIDTYNANPTSMMASLQNFTRMEAKDKMLILGDMLELGKESHSEHQKVVDYLKEQGFEEVVLVGKEFAATDSPFRTYPDAASLIDELKKNKPVGRTILIKGSNGIKLFTVPEYL
jgi:UDP-N-acetylmuramoyl-tripeptide--D-alanyl-D-alanine ligase